MEIYRYGDTDEYGGGEEIEVVPRREFPYLSGEVKTWRDQPIIDSRTLRGLWRKDKILTIDSDRRQLIENSGLPAELVRAIENWGRFGVALGTTIEPEESVDEWRPNVTCLSFPHVLQGKEIALFAIYNREGVNEISNFPIVNLAIPSPRVHPETGWRSVIYVLGLARYDQDGDVVAWANELPENRSEGDGVRGVIRIEPLVVTFGDNQYETRLTFEFDENLIGDIRSDLSTPPVHHDVRPASYPQVQFIRPEVDYSDQWQEVTARQNRITGVAFPVFDIIRPVEEEVIKRTNYTASSRYARLAEYGSGCPAVVNVVSPETGVSGVSLVEVYRHHACYAQGPGLGKGRERLSVMLPPSQAADHYNLVNSKTFSDKWSEEKSGIKTQKAKKIYAAACYGVISIWDTDELVGVKLVGSVTFDPRYFTDGLREYYFQELRNQPVGALESVDQLDSEKGLLLHSAERAEELLRFEREGLFYPYYVIESY